jgi:predicted nucleic acid-binding protein
MRVLIDNSILARLCRADDSQHDLCTRAISKLIEDGREPVISPQCIREFYAVATRPVTANGLGMTPAEAERQVGNFLATFTFQTETPAVFHRWLEIVSRFEVQGKSIHDANHVALMIASDIGHVLTLDTGFERYDGKLIGVRFPKDYLANEVNAE